jgi:hypothetical protein
MSQDTIKKHRLASQQLTETATWSPEGLVGHFGAMQAQDYAMAKWAIGLRTGKDVAAIEKAVADGHIIRTHILRPTWHFIAAKDIYWMLELTAPHVRTIVNSSNKKLGLDDKLLGKSKDIILRLLENGQSCTRGEIMARLNTNGIKTDGHIPSHLMMDAELDGSQKRKRWQGWQRHTSQVTGRRRSQISGGGRDCRWQIHVPPSNS